MPLGNCRGARAPSSEEEEDWLHYSLNDPSSLRPYHVLLLLLRYDISLYSYVDDSGFLDFFWIVVVV
jgi:hypothetical protein